MEERVVIRQASVSDAPALLAIYAPFVEDTAVSFETVVPTVDGFAGRIAKCLNGWQYLIAERGGRALYTWHDVGWFQRTLRSGPPQL